MEPGEQEKIKATWKRRLQQRKLARVQLQQEAWQRARAVASLLKSKWGVAKVYLYGSLVQGRFDALSDIDLFVSGLPPERNYWQMLAEAMELAKPFPISIVTEEDALPSLKKAVLEKGREL